MVTTFYPPHNFGGDGVFVQRLANSLARRGHEIHVIHDRDAFSLGSKALVANTSEGHDRTDPLVKVHSLSSGASGKLDLIAAHQLGYPVGKADELRRLLDQNFDVVHFHNVSLLGGPGVLSYGSGVKVCTLHDHWFVCATHVLWRNDEEACTKRTCMSCTLNAHRPPQIWRYTGAVERAAKHVHAFLAPSEFAKKSHLANGFPAPIRVLPHFLAEPSGFEAETGSVPVPVPVTVTGHVHGPGPGPASASASGSASDSASVPASASASASVHPKPYFLFVGRLEKIKGVQILIEQFKNFRDADLVIVGNGNYESTLREQAQQMEHIRFVGRMSSENLSRFYKQAVAVLVPSLCYETFGLVPLESFSNGTPVIVNDKGALPEVVADGGGIIYKSEAELLDAMRRLLSNAELRQTLGRAGYDNFRANYSESKHLEKYLGLIEELQRKQMEVSCPVVS